MEIIDITLKIYIQSYRVGKQHTENKALQYQKNIFNLLIIKMTRDLLARIEKMNQCSLINKFMYVKSCLKRSTLKNKKIE